MSTGQRLLLSDAVRVAERIVSTLRPHCQRIEIAGSVRRQKETVGDIEIVLIPNMLEVSDLFGAVIYAPEIAAITEAMLGAGCLLIKGGERYKQFDMPECKCDLFITDPGRWGMIYTIRTGSAEFTHKLVTPKSQGGWMPSYLQAEDGYIKRRGDKGVVPTPEEQDVFKAINMPWLDPRLR